MTKKEMDRWLSCSGITYHQRNKWRTFNFIDELAESKNRISISRAYRVSPVVDEVSFIKFTEYCEQWAYIHDWEFFDGQLFPKQKE